jgi:hypothetical protein
LRKSRKSSVFDKKEENKEIDDDPIQPEKMGSKDLLS